MKALTKVMNMHIVMDSGSTSVPTGTDRPPDAEPGEVVVHHHPAVVGQAEQAGQHDAGHHEGAADGRGPDPARHRVADAAAEGQRGTRSPRGAAAT